MESGQQIATFAIMLATGASIGLFFDFYRVIYKLLRPRPAIIYVTDLLFWLCATAFTFAALIMSNWGELRAYVFFGLFGGAILYFKLVSGLARIILLRLFRGIHFIVLWFNHLLWIAVFRPIAFIIRFVLRPFVFTQKRAVGLWKEHFKKPPDEKIPPNQ